MYKIISPPMESFSQGFNATVVIDDGPVQDYREAAEAVAADPGLWNALDLIQVVVRGSVGGRTFTYENTVSWEFMNDSATFARHVKRMTEELISNPKKIRGYDLGSQD